MTITSEQSSVEFVGNGSASTFSVPFRVLEKSHLVCTITSAAGTRALVENTDYTVTNTAAYTGWNVNLIDPTPETFGAPKVLDSGETLLIKRVLPLTQPSSFRSQTQFRAETHEDSLDRITMIVQQLSEQVNAGVLIPGAGTFFAGVLLGTKDGVNKVFALSNGGLPLLITPRQVTVWNNYALIKDVGYTLDGTTVTFTDAPQVSDYLFAQGS